MGSNSGYLNTTVIVLQVSHWNHSEYLMEVLVIEAKKLKLKTEWTAYKRFQIVKDPQCFSQHVIRRHKNTVLRVRIRNPVLFWPWIRDNFFLQILDLGIRLPNPYF
jgi:hypothetical protein